MDKNTLSQYGWNVVLILVLVILVTLASPFGTYIKGSTLSGTRSFINLTYTTLGLDIPLDEAPQCFNVDSAGVLSIASKYDTNSGIGHVCQEVEEEEWPSVKEYMKYIIYGLTIDSSVIKNVKTYDEWMAKNITDKKFSKQLSDVITSGLASEYEEDYPGYPLNDIVLSTLYMDELYDYDEEYPDECLFPELPDILSSEEILNSYIKPGVQKMAEEEGFTEEGAANDLLPELLEDSLNINPELLPEDIDLTNIDEVKKACKKTFGIDDPSAFTLYESFIHFYFDIDNLTIDDTLFILGGYEYIAMYHAALEDFSWDIHYFPVFNESLGNTFGSNSLDYIETVYKNKEYRLPDSFAIPETINGVTVTTIPDDLFKNCDCIVAVGLPNTITTIGEDAFCCCFKLTQINLQNVETIKDYAFQYCKSLKRVDLSSLTRIEERTFQLCESLEYVKLSNKLTYIGSSAFHSCRALTSIEIPSSVTDIEYHWAFYGCCNGDLSRFIIKGTKGSYAETYAKEHGYAFSSI